MRAALVVIMGLGLGLGCAGADARQLAEPALGVSTSPSPSRSRAVSRLRTTRAASVRAPAAPGLRPFAEGFVAAHNQARAGVSPAARPSLPPVRWSPQLAARAQAWADRCAFEHSTGDHGENLSARTHDAEPAEIVGGWVAEAADYNHARKRCAAGQVCGHYTQVVWRDSTQIGCAVARCGAGGPFGTEEWYLWVCNYSPAGNWSGERPY